MAAKIAFVTRATGAQGTAVTKNLLSAGYMVHALVNDPNDERSTPYQALSPSHIKLFAGSLEDELALKIALTGCTVMFLNLMPSFTEQSAEERQGKVVLGAAKAAGIKHVVYPTMLGLEAVAGKGAERYPYFTSIAAGKVKLEEALRKSGIERWTILRPGYFMTNFLLPLNQLLWPEISEGQAISSYRPTTVLNMTDVNDIGAFAVAAFENPQKFNGKVISLGSENLQVEEAIDQLRAASGREITSIYRTDEESARLMKEMPSIAPQLYYRDTNDIKLDVDEVRSWGVPLSSFAQFLEREKELVDRTFAKIQ